MPWPWSAEKVARGFADRKCLRRVVVAFDDETFEAIRGRALVEQTSFAEQVRRFVEWGMMDAPAPDAKDSQ